MFKCAAFESLPAASFSASASANGDAFEVGFGTAGQPGSMRINGNRQADGRLRLSGQGIAESAPYRGASYYTYMDGRFTGNRYEGRGRMGTRDCALDIAPR